MTKSIPARANQKDPSNTPTPRVRQSPWLTVAGLLLTFAMVVGIASIPLSLNEQLLFAAAALGLSMIIRPNTPEKRFRILVLVMISTIATARYIYWRFTQTLGWFDPHLELGISDYIFSGGLLAAEIYAWIILFLGYFQTLRPLEREIEPLPEDQSLWPTVDVFVPTYNEPLNVVKPTILAARDLDYPADKLNIYLLDDGDREEFRKFAQEAGVHYLARRDNKDAKAGNLNEALARTQGKLVAILDSDHVPVHAFLKSTVGWFLKDKELGLLQTPHIFYTPDPIERNLNTFRKIPNENHLFYGLIQPGNDTWNAAFFCGSCAVLRRQAIEEAGGISTESVTEDVHTSLRIQQQGWNSAYLREPLAAGLATERLSDHVRQRTRWAQGMVQMLRIDNPLFARGLSMGQRLAYLNSSMHFLFSLPRIVFLTSPLAFLFLNGYVLQASAGMIAVYALHHIFQAHIASSAMQSGCRHSFWAEVYETLLAGNILGPVLRAFLFPRSAKFNVTEKGLKLDEPRFDWRSSKFIIFLLLINLAGIGVGLWRLGQADPSTGDFGTLIITLLWTLYNCIILGAAVAVAFEHAQRRAAPRLPRTYQTQIIANDGASASTMTSDISTQGAAIRAPMDLKLQPGQSVRIILQDPLANKTFDATARVASLRGRQAGLEFDHLDIDQTRALVHFTHGRDEAWKTWYDRCEPKKPLASFFELTAFALRGISNILLGKSGANVPTPALAPVRNWLVIIIVLAAGLFFSHTARASEEPSSSPMRITLFDDQSLPQAMTATAQTPTRHKLRFGQLGVTDDIRLRGAGTQNDVWFTLRNDEVIEKATLHLVASFTPELAYSYRGLAIELNGQSVGRVDIDAKQTAPTTRWDIDLPRRMILDNNQLSFRLEPRQVGQCPDLDDDSGLTARILSSSSLDIDTLPLGLKPDLAQLPAPFFDANDPGQLTLPMIIPPQLKHSAPALKAAGIISSWFGALTDYRRADFPVTSAPEPLQRYSVAFATPDALPEQLDIGPIDGPAIALTAHPLRPTGQVLVIMGRNPEELVAASRALITTRFTAGQRHQFTASELHAGETAQGKTKWLPAGQQIALSSLASPSELVRHGDANSRIDINFRLPPDLFDWRQQHLLVPIVTEYEYRGPTPRPGSHLDISVNSKWHERVPLAGRNREQQRLQEGEFTVIRGKHLSRYPAIDMPDRNRLSYYFNIKTNENNDNSCQPAAGTNIIGSIGPGSHIDLGNMRRFTRLPDLAKFANLGFPFSRDPDLGSTVVHLPASPNSADLRLYLNALGHLGSATGSAGRRVEIVLANQPAPSDRPDHLFIGHFGRLPGLARYSDILPIEVDSSGSEPTAVHLTLMRKFSKWLKGESNNDSQRIRRYAKNHPDAPEIVGFADGRHTPVNAGVALLAKTPSASRALASALISPAAIATLHGDVAILDQGKFESGRILPTLNYGSLPPIVAIRTFFRSYPLALILWMGLTALFGAWVLHRGMRRRAQWRLRGRMSPRGIVYTRH